MDLKTKAIRERMPPLPPPSGPPLSLTGSVRGITAFESHEPRLDAVEHGFAVAVHPLRLPNTRALFSTASDVSVITFSFVRLAGLLADMVRPDVDSVVIEGMPKVYGYVPLQFDAFGFEFEQRCWVGHCPGAAWFVDLILGMDWAERYNPNIRWNPPIRIEDADAKRVRQVEDVYVTR